MREGLVALRHPGGEGLLVEIAVGCRRHVVPVHVGGGAVLVKFLPCVLGVDEAESLQDDGLAGERMVGPITGVKDAEVALEIALVPLGGEDVQLVRPGVRIALAIQLPPTFAGEAAMVEVFHRLLQTNGDEQANHNRGDVDEEVSPGGCGVVRRQCKTFRAYMASRLVGCGHPIPCH